MTIANSIFTGTLGGLILHALYAMLSQNAVFGRGLGSSRLTKLVNDEDGDAGVFCVLLLVVQVLSGVLSWAASWWCASALCSLWCSLRSCSCFPPEQPSAWCVSCPSLPSTAACWAL